MNNTVKTFMALLRGAVAPSEERLRLPEVNLASLLSLSKFHELAHLVYFSLKNEQIPIDGESRREFERQYDLAVMRHVHRTLAISKIRSALNRRKIPFILLKGAVLMDLYPESWMRTSSDVDVLVKPEDYRAAIDALTDAGLSFSGEGTHDSSLYTAEGEHVELHHTLIEEYRRPKTAEVLNEIWRHARLKQENVSEYLLDDEMLCYYHLAHMVKHFEEGGCGVRTFLDLWLLKREGRYNDLCAPLLERGMILAFAKRAEELCDVWFSNAERDPFLDAFEEYVINGGVYGTVGQRVAVLKKKRKKAGVSYYFSRLFPGKEEMKGRYPVLNERPILMPLYRVKRLFSLLDPKTRHRAKVEIDAEKKNDNDAAKNIETMMKDLGIW